MDFKLKKTKNWLVLVLAFSSATYGKEDSLCKPMRDFVKSIKPDQKYAIEFHTCWLCSFSDEEDQDSFYSKRCIHNNYDPAKVVCNSLMEHSSVEFSSYNFLRVLYCLSPKTKLAEDVRFESGSLSFHYGSENSGANIYMSLNADEKIGGSVMKIEAEGY